MFPVDVLTYYLFKDKFVKTYKNLPEGWSSDLRFFRDFDQEVEKTKKDRVLDFLMERFRE